MKREKKQTNKKKKTKKTTILPLKQASHCQVIKKKWTNLHTYLHTIIDKYEFTNIGCFFFTSLHILNRINELFRDLYFLTVLNETFFFLVRSEKEKKIWFINKNNIATDQKEEKKRHIQNMMLGKKKFKIAKSNQEENIYYTN